MQCILFYLGLAIVLTRKFLFLRKMLYFATILSINSQHENVNICYDFWLLNFWQMTNADISPILTCDVTFMYKCKEWLIRKKLNCQ